MLQLATETLILLMKDIDADAVLAVPDDVIEVPKKLPSLIIQGPTLTENRLRRTPTHLIIKDIPAMTYAEGQHPRLYHLDFDMIVTARNPGELMQMMSRVALLFHATPSITLPDDSTLNLTELVPLGGLRRVNLSKLSQASGRCRIEDCPVVGATLVDETSGKLVQTVTIETHCTE